MDDQPVGLELNEVCLFQRRGERLQVLVEQGNQLAVADVPGCDDQKPTRLRAQKVAVAEVTILGYDHSVFAVGRFSNLLIGRTVAIRKL